MAINLLKLYKDKYTTAADMTPEQALTNPEFIRFASYMMGWNFYNQIFDDVNKILTINIY